MRRHLGTRLEAIPEKPVFVYNTWEPFRKDIDESLIYEVVDAAADCDMEEFVIDDGWNTNYGDWEIDREKFPNGLKPVFDYIKFKEMKPGLWISIAGASASPINLHSDQDRIYRDVTYSMCMSTGWYDHIKGIILNLVKEHGLEYLKGDFAVATGASTTDKTRSGCHATDHPHKDREESLLSLSRRTWQLFDEPHEEAPDLFIDCTFKTMGAYQLIDLDMCKHAEGCWLSNYYEAPPAGALRVRHMAWWRPYAGDIACRPDLAAHPFHARRKLLIGFEIPPLVQGPAFVDEKHVERHVVAFKGGNISPKKCFIVFICMVIPGTVDRIRPG